jgi:hypothetical protein
MSIEDMKAVSAAPATYSVTGWFDPRFNESPEERIYRKGEEEKRFRNQNDFMELEGVEVYREKGSKGCWVNKETGRLFCSCGNGRLKVFQQDYSATYECGECSKTGDIYDD